MRPEPVLHALTEDKKETLCGTRGLGHYVMSMKEFLERDHKLFIQCEKCMAHPSVGLHLLRDS
jgi:hypothetical protein